METLEKLLNKNKDIISIILVGQDFNFEQSLIVNMNMTTTELILKLNKTIYDPKDSNIKYYYVYRGEEIKPSSNKLKSIKIEDNSIVLANKLEYENNEIIEEIYIHKNKFEPKNEISKDLISILLISSDQNIKRSLIVNINMTSAELILLLNKTILEYYPEKSMFGFSFLYRGEFLCYSSFKLKKNNFRDGAVILAIELESMGNSNHAKKIINLDKLKLDDKLENIIVLRLISTDQCVSTYIKINKFRTLYELIYLLYKNLEENYPQYTQSQITYLCNGNTIYANSLTLDEAKIRDGDIILMNLIEPMFEENLEMDASILMNKYNDYDENFTFDLHGLLRLCLLKEISIYFYNDFEYYDEKVSNKIKYILEVISGGNIDLNKTKNSIMSILWKLGGQYNIINYSKYIDANMSKEKLKELFNILKDDKKSKINKKKNCLFSYVDYMEKFENEFEKAKRESVFEYTINSLTIVDRENRLYFEEAKEECPNKIERILFHGTGIKPCTEILTDMFKRSEKSGYQFGKGVYFTDSLDYAWYYGGKNNRDNLNKIPKVDDTFIFVGSLIYYDNKGYKRVYDHKRQPKMNEINFALANAKTATIFEEKPDLTKFYGTEYVIYEKEQICPFIGCSIKRDEFCVIWRDVNFSKKPVYNNEFDEIFKKFLKQRMEYIQEQVKFNAYPCQTSEEALKLIKRKKYSKIILISNVGDDLSGKNFIKDARKIIGSDIIALFLCYNKSHLNWIKDFKNSLFSNDAKFYEEYLECFVTETKLDLNKKNQIIKGKVLELIKKIQGKYGVKFKFYNDFLNYPNFKNEGNFSDLTF